MYQNDPQKVLTGECRLSYVFLNEPQIRIDKKTGLQDGEPKYNVTLLIPKSDTETLKAIKEAMEAANDHGLKKLWGGMQPRYASVLHDGDGTKENGAPYSDECKGCWVMTASSLKKPQVVSPKNTRVCLPPEEVYSGMYGRVTIRFYAYANSSRGVAAGLGNVLKTRDGEPLTGGASAAVDFEGFEEAGGAASDFGGVDPITGMTIVNPITGLPY